MCWSCQDSLKRSLTGSVPQVSHRLPYPRQMVGSTRTTKACDVAQLMMSINGSPWSQAGSGIGVAEPPLEATPSRRVYGNPVTLTYIPAGFGARPSDIPAQITERPTGPGYQRYEDLYQTGDTVTQAMERCADKAIITFPEGEFLTSGFPTAQGYASIIIPKKCKGIIGAGKGTLNGSTGTVFKLVENSNTQYDPPSVGSSLASLARIMMQIDGYYDLTLANFQLAGSEQVKSGRITPFHGMTIYNPNGRVTMHDMMATGWYGDLTHPPGETFGLSIRGKTGSPAYHGHRVARLETDGRRVPGGPIYGVSGGWFANTIGGYWVDCHFHHGKGSPWVSYQVFDTDMYDNSYDHSGVPASEGISVNCVNHERSDGITHFRGKFLRTTVDKGKHMTHSNDNWSANYDGLGVRSVTNGTTTVVAPTFTNLHGRNKFIIESWTPYSIGGMEVGGDSMVTPPKVVQADGVTTIPYNWLHGAWIDIP